MGSQSGNNNKGMEYRRIERYWTADQLSLVMELIEKIGATYWTNNNANK